MAMQRTIHPVNFTTTKKWNRRRVLCGLTWREAAETGIAVQEQAISLSKERAKSKQLRDAASTVSAA